MSRNDMETFAKLSTRLWQNEKVRLFAMERPSAFAVWTFAISYCAGELNDGELSRFHLKCLLGASDEDIDALIDARLLDEHEDGTLWLHDFVAAQGRSRADVEETKAKKAEAGRKGGKASGEARTAKQTASKTKQTRSTSEAEPKQTASKTKQTRSTSEAEPKQTASKTKQTRSTSEAEPKQTASKTKPDTDTDTDTDISINPLNPPRPDFDALLDRIESFYPPNRFDGKTSKTRTQLEIDWPKIVRAAGEGQGDPAGFLEAKARSYAESTESRYVVRFSKFLGGEFYERNWVAEPEPTARPSPGTPATKSRSQANREANMANTWKWMTPAERAEYQRTQGGTNDAQQG